MVKLFLLALSATASAFSGFTVNGGGPCGEGEYAWPGKWCSQAQNTRISFPNGSSGWLNRECVSYVGYMFYTHHQQMPKGRIPIAADWGGPFSHTPTVHSAAIWSPHAGGSGHAGHVAYVTAVSADSITVSEFNFDTGAGTFRYSSRTIPRGSSYWPSRFSGGTAGGAASAAAAAPAKQEPRCPHDASGACLGSLPAEQILRSVPATSAVAPAAPAKQPLSCPHNAAGVCLGVF